jgi:hypothetical protein
MYVQYRNITDRIQLRYSQTQTNSVPLLLLEMKKGILKICYYNFYYENFNKKEKESNFRKKQRKIPLKITQERDKPGD